MAVKSHAYGTNINSLGNIEPPLYELDGTASFILPPTLSTGSKNDDPVLGKEVLQNIVSGTESLKYSYLGDHGYIPSTAQTGFRWLGRVGGASGSIFSITDCHEDYQKYSGGDLAIAWGTNMIPIGAGLLGASLGATGGAYVGGIVGGGTGALTGGTAGTVLGPEGTIVGGGVGGIVGGFTGVGVGAFIGSYAGGIVGGTAGAYIKDYIRKDIYPIKTDKEKESLAHGEE